MKTKFDRVISIATLAALIVAIIVLVRKPAPVGQQPEAASRSAATTQPSDPQSSPQRADQPEAVTRETQATQTTPVQSAGSYSAGNMAIRSSQPAQNSAAPPPQKTEAANHAAEISAAVSQLLGASGAGLTPDSNVGEGMPNIKDQKVTYDGDTVHGQFLTEIGGKDVWIAIAGHMGQKDGYATFDPTEFRVGNVEVPVSLVNPMLQRKLSEERDRMKIADPAK